MKRTIKNLLISAFSVAALALGACSDWTETESLGLHQPTFEEQNPELYNQYLESLRAYKLSDHKIVYLSMNASAKAPSLRNQHVTNMPDSADFICLSFEAPLLPIYTQEMQEVRTKKGTRTVYPISYDELESRWKVILEEEEAAKPETPAEGEGDAAGDGEGDGEGDGGEEEPAGPTDEERFLAFCAEQTALQLAYCDQYGFDGIEIIYSGKAPESMTEEVKAAYALRQQTFLSAVASWKEAHASSVLFFRGNPQNLIDKTILTSCHNIIIPALSASSNSELTYSVIMSITSGVPTDRFLVGVKIPSLTDPADFTGYFAGYDTDGKSKLYATKGAAQWVTAGGQKFTKKGIAISDAHNDYFNIKMVYTHLREAINIMNPTSNN